MTTDVFIPYGYASKTFWPVKSKAEGSTIDLGEKSKVVNIQPFCVYQQDHPHIIRKRNNHYGAMPRCRASANESLDLVRKVLQPAINHDIVEVFKKYLPTFHDAAENINTNMQTEPFTNFATDDDLNPESMVYKLCCDALDHCKTLFGLARPAGVLQKSEPVKASTPPAAKPSPAVASSLPNRLLPKRVPSPDFPWNKRLAKSSPRRSLSPTPRPSKRSRANKRYGSPLSGREAVKRENWDPDRLTVDTNFIMGTRANKALGLGATRGRIYMKHPDLFKYSSDPEDKKWMVKHNCMQATGGKNTFILIADDIYDLLENDYKDNPHVIKEELQVFKLPEFILQKMRNLMGKEPKTSMKLLSQPTAIATPKSEIQARSAGSSPLIERKSAESPSHSQHSKRSAAEKATAVIIAGREVCMAERMDFVENSEPESSSVDDGSGSDYDGDNGKTVKN